MICLYCILLIVYTRVMYARMAAEKRLDDLATWLRVVIVNGPRQSGKTTLLTQYRERHKGTYVTLDDTFQLEQARLDPMTFVEQGEPPLMIDEVQRGGDALVRAVKMVVDQRQQRGQFILSGSAKFLTIPTLSESLAGRAGFQELWPLSMSELTGGPAGFIDQIFTEPSRAVSGASPWRRDDYLDAITRGGYPEAVTIPVAPARRAWYDGYLDTVITRDIGDFASVQNGGALRRALALLAARSGSVLVGADLARSLQISAETTRNYLAYLEMVFLTLTIPAWSTNLTSKIAKSPKVFVTDSGLASHLLRASPASLKPVGHPALGGLLETFVLSELNKLRAISETDVLIHHLRDRQGAEVDFILEGPDGKIVAIEVKATASPASNDARHLYWLKEKLGDQLIAGVVLHLGSAAGSLGERILALPVSALWGNAVPPTTRR